MIQARRGLTKESIEEILRCPDAVADREHPEDEDEDEEAGKSRNGRERMAKRGPIRFASGFSLLIHLSPVPQHPAAGLGSPSVLTGTQTKLRTRRKVNRSAAPRGALVNFFSSDNQVLIFTLLLNDRTTTRSCQSRSATFLSFFLNFFLNSFFRRFWIFLSGIILLSKTAKGDREVLAGAVAFGIYVRDKLAPILAGSTWECAYFFPNFELVQSAVASRVSEQMGDDMWRLWFTKLLLLVTLLLTITVQIRSEGECRSNRARLYT